MSIYEIYKKETGKDATQFINHGIIFTSDYIKWLEEKYTSTNKPSDEISICRGGDDVCEFKSVSYCCRNPEWCSYKLKLSHVD